jgi:hypothetical protein
LTFGVGKGNCESTLEADNSMAKILLVVEEAEARIHSGALSIAGTACE